MGSPIKSEESSKSKIQNDLGNLIKENDNISWVAYQEKDRNSTFSDYGAYGNGYEDPEETSFMPLLATIYRNLQYKLFDEVLYEENKINKPCYIIKEYSTSDNSINKIDENCLIVKYYGDSKAVIDNFWNNIRNKQQFNIVNDIKNIIETTLNCKLNISKEEISNTPLSPNNIEDRFNASKKILDIINVAISTDIEIKKSFFYSDSKKNKEKILLIGSLLFPWEMLVYDDFSICFGTSQNVEGGVTISYREKLAEDERKRNNNIVSDKLNILKLISIRKIWEDNILYRKILSIRTAKAAIMSRNMSHNLGSHVMSYLKQHLCSVKDMLNERVLSILLDDESDLIRKLGSLNSIKDTVAYNEWSNLLKKLESLDSKVANCDNVALPFLVGLGHFISYLQERQDFIATIATDFIPYYSTVNFKDFIYDELNPDKRYERHRDRANMQIDNILLGNIARSEGLGRPTSPTRKNESSNNLGDIIIKFRDFDGDPVVDGNIEAQSLKEMRQYDVSLPGGIVGRQAIFSIVENVIRNAAKHGNWHDSRKLELTFDIYTKDDMDKQTAHKPLSNDNKPGDTLFDVLYKHYMNASDSNDLYFVTMTDNLSCDAEKLNKLDAAIKEEYVDENGNMNESNKGIKEMKISASWLRSIKEEEVDAEDNRAPILYVRTSNGHLQYIFCLMRPKKVAIISPMYGSGKNHKKDEFDKISWGAFTSQEFVSLPNKSYEFILFDDKKYHIDEYNQIRSISSSRLYKLSEICGKGGIPLYDDLCRKIEDGFDKQEAERLLTELYRHIADYQEGDCISIMDEKAHRNNGGGNKPFIQKGIVTICKSSSDKETTHPYIYLSHYETNSNFSKVCDLLKPKGLYENNRFIEGITGNNSTDRLIREEELTDLWAYKHLHAMKEKIAIFDERIFSKIFGIEEKDIRRNLHKGDVEKIDLNELKDIYIKYFDSHREKYYLVTDSEYSIVCKAIKNKRSVDELKQFIAVYGCTEVPINESIKQICSNSYTGTAFAQKGIYVFTFIQDYDENKKSIFYLCGLQWNNINEATSTLQMINGEYCSKCEVLAIVRWDDNNQKLSIEKCPKAKTLEKNYSGLFGKISIHQGLLDKFYEVFGIKDNQSAKECLTKDLYEYFSKNKGKDAFTISKHNDDVKKWYLPGMCVHSGRSKPSEADMPQHLPFIQYASIEHAVLDCKYSLVELLDFARYE